MKLTQSKIISYVTVIALMICYYYVPEETLFASFSGFLIVVLFVISVMYTNRAIMEYEDDEIEKGKKHREKLLGINLLILYLMFLATLLYFVGYVSEVTWFILGFVILCMVIMILYFVLAFILDYIILHEDGFTSKYFIKPKSITIKYKDIKEIRFGKLMNKLTIITDTEKAYIDIGLKNCDKILNEISKKTFNKIHKDAFLEIEKYFRNLGLKKNLDKLKYFKKAKQSNK